MFKYLIALASGILSVLIFNSFIPIQPPFDLIALLAVLAVLCGLAGWLLLRSD